MTKYEVAKQILTDNNLPSKQLDNLEVLEKQVLDLALKLYPTHAKNLGEISIEEARVSINCLTGMINGAALFMLVVAADIHNFRMATLRRYLEVPPEMQIDDIISRLTTRSSDLVGFDDAPNMCIAKNGQKAPDVVPCTSCEAQCDVVFDKVEKTEKGKEEGKEESTPHTPLKEKGKEEIQKEPLSRARVKLRKDDPAFVSFFDKFWAKYPRKVSKLKAKTGLFAYWKNRVRKAQFENEVLTALDKWLACEQWKDPIYIPHPTTWVNQKRWMVVDDSINLRRPQRRVSGVSQTANVKSNRAKGLW